jgi:hypothetical protein
MVLNTGCTVFRDATVTGEQSRAIVNQIRHGPFGATVSELQYHAAIVRSPDVKYPTL